MDKSKTCVSSVTPAKDSVIKRHSFLDCTCSSGVTRLSNKQKNLSLISNMTGNREREQSHQVRSHIVDYLFREKSKDSTEVSSISVLCKQCMDAHNGHILLYLHVSLCVVCLWVSEEGCVVFLLLRLVGSSSCSVVLTMHKLGGFTTETLNCNWHFGHSQCLCQWALGWWETSLLTRATWKLQRRLKCWTAGSTIKSQKNIKHSRTVQF